MIIWGPRVSTEDLPPEAAHANLTRRVLLVAGGVTLLAACSGTAEQVAYVTQSAKTRPGPSASARSASTTATQGRTPSGRVAPARDPHALTSPDRAHLARKERLGPRAARRAGRREETPMFYVDDGRKGIALTIDDGPNPVYTPQILRLLEKYRVTASFSMIGLEVDTYPGVAREVAAAGHVIANHTWSHPDMAYLYPVAVADQMNRATDAIHRVTGRVPTLFRAPYGAWSPAVLQQCVKTGMTPLDWSVDPRDWSRPGVASIVRNIMGNTRTGSIILEHDGGGDRSQTVAALKIVLPRLLAAGYHFHTP
jgi:peptidoglycan/xylan/chitin deacetylase (PgdA/CDA1 family)